MFSSLIKKGRIGVLSTKKRDDSLSIEHPPLSLLGLPMELLQKVLQNLELRDWLTLALVCRYLQEVVDKYFLYNNVRLLNESSLRLFKKAISRDKKRNLLSLYVHGIEFHKPVKSTQEQTSIAGFGFSSRPDNDSYIALMVEVISLLPNLSCISVLQISPGFCFPEWTSTLKTYAFEHNYYPSIRKLTLSSQQGWSIALRSNLLWPFGLIEELCLVEMIIDSSSLKKPPLLTVSNEEGPLISPLITKNALKMESTVTWSPIKILSLASCSIANNASRFLAGYFRDVHTLKLVSMKSHYDVLLSNCFPNLRTLYIDLNSKAFSLYNASEASVINTSNANSNFAYFNSQFVPKFYLNYNHFKEIMDKVPVVDTIVLTNVSFSNVKPVDPEDITNEDHNIVNNNGYVFLKSLQRFGMVQFILLKNYKLHKTRTRDEWSELLKPCFSSTNCVRVKDKDGSVLYSRNEKCYN
ncbi:unnamed protein product [Cyberlindnera jadinii]|uniref:F-box domain-containing protein n=1 Tax=Cyberlindnera jadinii (strain ATCC 18201 / CBS 1600 / BCRC 20928 / JCM 3617 / NBRC 0987 / NRRL Y-1542) TaxID=983966 RepID=A0A0H5CKK2_CYBJN|nr:unnamed protein product [Cyberlindnera jadinii]